jgi:hypothetical protein
MRSAGNGVDSLVWRSRGCCQVLQLSHLASQGQRPGVSAGRCELVLVRDEGLAVEWPGDGLLARNVELAVRPGVHGQTATGDSTPTPTPNAGAIRPSRTIAVRPLLWCAQGRAAHACVHSQLTPWWSCIAAAEPSIVPLSRLLCAGHSSVQRASVRPMPLSSCYAPSRHRGWGGTKAIGGAES